MAYQVRTELAAPRALAAARAVTTPQRLGTDMIAALDQVWPLLREQGARHGHNIVIYYTSAAGGELTIDAGVEVPGGSTPRGAVRPVDTPAGETAVVTHLSRAALSRLMPGELIGWVASAAVSRWNPRATETFA